MALSMKENSETTEWKDLESSQTLTETTTKVSGKMIKLKAAVCSNLLMDQYTKVNGITIRNGELVLKLGKMAASMKEVTNKETRLDSADIHGQMEIHS